MNTGSSQPDMYVIRLKGLSRQLSDRARIVYFGVFYSVLLASLLASTRGGSLHPLWHGATIGAFIGTLPSLWLGSVASMPVMGARDWARAGIYLKGHRHRLEGRAWIPDLRRWMYFNSQIVRYEDGCIIGPIETLKKLRRVLAAGDEET